MNSACVCLHPLQRILCLRIAADIVHRQLQCKKRLCVELDNDRRRLARMQHEIDTLRTPMPADGASRLEEDIARLQASCKQMVQLVEEAGPYGEFSGVFRL